jgi:rhodanese-related sulfurtransferase
MKQDIQPKELSNWLGAGEPLRIVDVRSPEEFAEGHIPGAENIPLNEIERSLPGVAAEERVVIVCHSGMRSATACEKIAATYPRLLNVIGGTSAWKLAGYRVESGA